MKQKKSNISKEKQNANRKTANDNNRTMIINFPFTEQMLKAILKHYKQTVSKQLVKYSLDASPILLYTYA